jgi:uncharacterized protein
VIFPGLAAEALERAMYYDLLLHVDTDDASLAAALRNAANYTKAGIDVPYNIALVVNGKAVSLLRRATCLHKEAITALCSQNMRLYVCNNALSEQGLDADAIVAEAEVVPAGIVQIVTLQREGFAYVKP